MSCKTKNIRHKMYKSQLHNSDWKMHLTIFVLFPLLQNYLHYTVKIYQKIGALSVHVSLHENWVQFQHI